jgi:hypothetical protein
MQTYKQTDRQTERQKDTKTDRQKDRKTDRQDDRKTDSRPNNLGAGHNQILARQKQRHCLQITRANSFIILTVGAVAAEKGQALQIETIIFGFNKIICIY